MRATIQMALYFSSISGPETWISQAAEVAASWSRVSTPEGRHWPKSPVSRAATP